MEHKRRKRNTTNSNDLKNKRFANDPCLTRHGLDAKLLEQKKEVTTAVLKEKRLTRSEDAIE